MNRAMISSNTLHTFILACNKVVRLVCFKLYRPNYVIMDIVINKYHSVLMLVSKSTMVPRQNIMYRN